MTYCPDYACGHSRVCNGELSSNTNARKCLSLLLPSQRLEVYYD